MAKNNRTSAVRDRSQRSGHWVKRDADNGRSVVHREVLFPTEPSTIGRKKIDRAVEQVASRKK